MDLNNISVEELEHELTYRYDILRTYKNDFDGMKNAVYAEIEYLKLLLSQQSEHL